MESQDQLPEENIQYGVDNLESHTDTSEISEYTWESTYEYTDSSVEYSRSSCTSNSSDSVFYSDEITDDLDASQTLTDSTEVAEASSGSSGPNTSSDTDTRDDTVRIFRSKGDITLMPASSAEAREDVSGISAACREDQKHDKECKPKVTVRTQMPQRIGKMAEEYSSAPETSGYSRELTSNTDRKHDKDGAGEECKMTSSIKTVKTQMPQSIGRMAEEHDGKAGESSGYNKSKTIEDIDRLLLDHRTNIQNELEQLKLGDKPVTGQGHKEAVENFFSRSQDSDEYPSSEHRPEKISLEVSALVDSRRVSSLLQSDRFMRRLESSLLGGGGKKRSRRMSWAGPYQPTTSDQPSAPRRRRHSLYHSHTSQSLQSHVRSTEEGSRSQPDDRSLDMIAEEDAVAQAKRHQMIGDISELVERELVKSSLEGKFRKNLERLMGNRLHHSHTDGKQVKRVTKSLPPSHQERNDFSHLDVNTEDRYDQIAVISTTARLSSRHSQLNAGLSSEVAALKAQLNEMKTMLKASYDAQLDIQRAIRQEVAAAINSQQIESNDEDDAHSKAVSLLPPQEVVPYKNGKCAICLKLDVDTVLYKCGHMCVCYGCGMNMKARKALCPRCQAPIRDVIRTYR